MRQHLWVRDSSPLRNYITRSRLVTPGINTHLQKHTMAFRNRASADDFEEVASTSVPGRQTSNHFPCDKKPNACTLPAFLTTSYLRRNLIIDLQSQS